jgi:hypothetical protein
MHTSQQLEGCWIELVDRGIDVYGGSALLTIQAMRFPIVGHGAAGTRSACLSKAWTELGQTCMGSRGIQREMRSHAADRHLHTRTGSRRVADTRRGGRRDRASHRNALGSCSRSRLCCKHHSRP